MCIRDSHRQHPVELVVAVGGLLSAHGHRNAVTHEEDPKAHLLALGHRRGQAYRGVGRVLTVGGTVEDHQNVHEFVESFCWWGWGRRSQRRYSMSPSRSSRRHSTLPGTTWLGRATTQDRAPRWQVVTGTEVTGGRLTRHLTGPAYRPIAPRACPRAAVAQAGRAGSATEPRRRRARSTRRGSTRPPRRRRIARPSAVRAPRPAPTPRRGCALRRTHGADGRRVRRPARCGHDASAPRVARPRPRRRRPRRGRQRGPGRRQPGEPRPHRARRRTGPPRHRRRGGNARSYLPYGCAPTQLSLI